MRILLIRTFKDVGAGGSIPPLGLLYLSSSLKKKFGAEAETRLLDTYFFRDPEKEIKRAVSEYRPFLAGISAMACEKNSAFAAASAVKKVSPSSFTVIGGPYPTFSPENALSRGSLDFAVLGEGEETFTELAGALFSGSKSFAGIKGLAFRENGKVCVNQPGPFADNLDELPLPDWDLVDLKNYGKVPTWNGYNKFGIYAPILTSRGCPYKCVYCHNMFGKTVRKRSVANVLGEMLLLRKKVGVREFHIIDDIFNADKRRLLEFCSLFAQKLPGCALAFPNGLRADLLDGESAAALRKAGAYKIHFGIESASDRVREAAGKNLSLEAADRGIKAAGELGITTAGYFMFGLPGETPEDAKKTIAYASSSDLDIAYFFKATAYPGTEFYGAAGGQGDGSFFDVSDSASDEESKRLENLLLDAHLKFYLSFGRLWKLMRKSHDKAGFLKNLPVFLAKLLLLKLSFELGKK